MASSGVKIVFGTGGVGADNRHYNNVESVHQIFEVLKKHGVDTLDTAQYVSFAILPYHPAGH